MGAKLQKYPDLVSCEYSATVSNAIRAAGREVWSNDILETEGDTAWHITGCCEEAISSRRWGLIIIHIPCTAMAVCGNSTYGLNLDGSPKPLNHERIEAQEWSLRVWELAKQHADAVAMENPASTLFPLLKARGADVQYIQPYEFGHMEQKKTGLALHNLPRLKPTNNVYTEMMKLPRKERERIHFMSPGPDRQKERARFYSGFAEAMATQWVPPFYPTTLF